MRNEAFERLFPKEEFKMKTVKELMEDWKEYKKLETSVAAQRLSVEAEIYRAMMKEKKFPHEGTTTRDEDGLRLKIVTKLNATVDQDFAAANSELFKAKYEYSKSLLKELSPEQVKLVAEGVVFKPAKPSFSVEEIKE